MTTRPRTPPPVQLSVPSKTGSAPRLESSISLPNNHSEAWMTWAASASSSRPPLAGPVHADSASRLEASISLPHRSEAHLNVPNRVESWMTWAAPATTSRPYSTGPVQVGSAPRLDTSVSLPHRSKAPPTRPESWMTWADSVQVGSSRPSSVVPMQSGFDARSVVSFTTCNFPPPLPSTPAGLAMHIELPDHLLPLAVETLHVPAPPLTGTTRTNNTPSPEHNHSPDPETATVSSCPAPLVVAGPAVCVEPRGHGSRPDGEPDVSPPLLPDTSLVPAPDPGPLDPSCFPDTPLANAHNESVVSHNIDSPSPTINNVPPSHTFSSHVHISILNRSLDHIHITWYDENGKVKVREDNKTRWLDESIPPHAIKEIWVEVHVVQRFRLRRGLTFLDDSRAFTRHQEFDLAMFFQ